MAAAWAALLALLAVMLGMRRRQRLPRQAWPLWAAAAGLLLVLARIEHRLADELAPGNENRVSRVVLRVADLVRLGPDNRRFEAEVIESIPAGVPSRILVSWNAPGYAGPYGRRGAPSQPFPELVPGQVWRMSLNLKRPQGIRNPGGFDYEGHAFARGLRASGSVRGTPRYLRDEPWAGLAIVANRVRHYVRRAMSPHLQGMRYGPVLLALVIGDQAGVDAADWQVFNRSGITHLVSISGSHITMIAALGAVAMYWLWRRARWRGRALAERMPAQVAAASTALLVAWLYCLLAGWGVPAQRTFLMLAVAAGGQILRLPVKASRLLCIALCAVVLLDPWAPLASGFWLSFGAVCVLLAAQSWVGQAAAGLQETRPRRAWRLVCAAARLQLAINAALMPLLALIFHQVSLVSPLSNAYAIPLVEMVITPVSLLAAACAVVPGLDSAAGGLAWLAHAVLQAAMWPTQWLAALPAASVGVPQAPWWAVALAFLGVGVAMLPRGFPARHGGWLLILPALAWRPEKPPPGGWDMYALDVGQSSAIVVQTAAHALLFDTGLRIGPDADQGARTIVPFLQARGIRRLDAMVISHADIDHVGGARSVLREIPVQQSYSSFDLDAYLRREAGLLGMATDTVRRPMALSGCERGMAWEVDGVRFEFFWPEGSAASRVSARARTPVVFNAADSSTSKSVGLVEPSNAPQKASVAYVSGKSGNRRNGQSCVLRISGAHHSLLLTGDIGAAQETALVRSGLPPTDVAMAAHHGSSGSSAPRFIARLQAAHVVAQVGRWNRYGHPGRGVEQRWRRAGTEFWRTDLHGAITVRSRPTGLTAQAERQQYPRYWQGR
ncbi:DNA internalization-related competence protein ComEC/Rec2 [Candidimonas nitroreducens]|uniref:DNA internalization-related competence protein ComEC/Rec2 n=2 Tax=Candidimonas nitroreducens TaxID=683354 RepID=A0A225MX61_9BURK|nr:DNA internalization-related competence protein ComEC/Rec2 [Candidimonas nitroreducens]